MLQIKDLVVAFVNQGNLEKAVAGVSFELEPGEILGIVGESGSGKTMTALSILGLLTGEGVLETGEIRLDGQELLGLSLKERRSYCGKEISMIFQEPMTALNPNMKIGIQVEEALKLHTNLTKKERRDKVYEVLIEVELEDPKELYNKYPHELSGGMRQRVMIAAAIIGHPKVLIADEPTTALDINTQKHILSLLKKLNRKYQMSILFISHNLRVVQELCEKVLVMKEGVIVERGFVEEVFLNPKESYTQLLISAIPEKVKGNTLSQFIRNG